MKEVKRNLLLAFMVIGGYLVVYLLGRVFGTTGEPMSAMGWLFGRNWRQLPYLYGWLLSQNIFWVAMAISVVPALFGKKYFSFTTLFGFAIALLIGELCGENPAGAAYGHGHYGWAIWGGIFFLSIGMGIALEKGNQGKLDLRSPKLWIWLGVFVAGILAIVLGIRASMPTSFR